jgi:ATP-dependent RNA helicase DeaD
MSFPPTHTALARALAARDYATPTSVQIAVLEADVIGKDLLVSAQTGSGKTVAFGLAMASTLLGDAERFERANDILALIIAPTRELAMQVQRELDWLYAETGASVITCVGGMDPRAEARALERGAHIVVGTPGRLRDHIERNRLDLSKLKTIVLDEADEMLDLGFREDLEFILEKTPEERQTLMFSATMPREIERLARRFQKDAKRIETLRRNEQHADIEYQAIRVVPGDTENAVVNVLRFHDARATLVFCSTREAVKRTHARLSERGFSAVALSGELTQSERTTALQALRDNRARVLVATDVAARGLDLPDLTLVIHADLPNDSETLLHRSGRTGRAGKKGLCVLIVPFNKRRKAEDLMTGAKLKVTWCAAPSPDAIRTRDHERFLADPMFTEAATEDDLVGAKALQEARSADEIAVALLRMHRASLPAPEELAEDRGPPRRDNSVGDRPRFNDRAERGDRPSYGRDRSERSAPVGERQGYIARPFAERSNEGRSASERVQGDSMHERAPYRPAERSERNEAPRTSGYSDRFSDRTERAPRPSRYQDDRPMVWFRLNIGRERNADPKWLLPLICKAGGVTKSEIGSIKIADRDTRFEIIAEIADQFAESVRVNPAKEGHIARADAPSENNSSYDRPAERPARSERPRSDRTSDRAERPQYERQHEAPVEASAAPAPAVEAPVEAVKPERSVDDKPFKAKAFKDKPANDDASERKPYVKADKPYAKSDKPYAKADKPYVKADKPYVKKWDKSGAGEPRGDAKPRSDEHKSGYVARDRAPFVASSDRAPRSRDDKPRSFDDKPRSYVKRDGEKRDFGKSDGPKRDAAPKGAFKGASSYKGAGGKGKFAAGPKPATGYVARDMKSDRGEMSASKYASKKKQRETPPASSTG